MPTNGMTINGLNPLSALTADDKIPVWDTGASGEPTKEITAQNMANSVKSLADLPNTTEMNTAIEQSTAIKYTEINVQSVTVSSKGYGDIKSYKPSGMTNFLFALLWNYSTNDANGCVNVLANGDYLLASANATITNVRVRYYYKD